MEQHYEELMVKVTDGVATPAEHEALMSWLADKPDLARELESHRALKAVTDGWMVRLEADLAQDQHQASTGWRVETAIGLVLFLVGCALLLGWGVVEVFLDPAAPLPVKLGLGALGAGSLVLLAAVVRWRFRTNTKDPYEEVVR